MGTFYAGSTYHVPYGQPIYSGSYVGFSGGSAIDDSSIDTYLEAADPNSIFYSGRSYYTGKQAPYYSNDCSAFVSWCWGVSRKTTASNNYNLQLGDALNSNSAGHVVLVTGLSYNEWGAITTIEITEQTPPQLKKSYYTPESLGSKYGGRYSIQRYYGDVPAAPNSRPVGTSPMDSFADEFFGIDSKHGYDTVIRTAKRGEQTVYAYVINIGNGDNVYLGSKVVTIGDVLIGDADGNGEITIADVTRVQRIVAGIVVEEEFNTAADVDGNGQIDIRDATLIQRYLAKYIDKFPVEE